MLGYETQIELAEYLKAVATAEIEVETARSSLTEKNEFEPILAFHRIDYKNQGQITYDALRRFLIDVEIPAMKSDIDSIFKHYDSNNDGQLTYSDFLKLCLPASKPGLREKALTRQHPRYYVNKRLPFRVEWGIARILEREILVNRNLVLLRKLLTGRSDWDITDAFALLDYEKKGTVDPYALLIYLRRNQIAANYETVISLLRRIDRDNDELLSYPDFVQAFIPNEQLDFKSLAQIAPTEETLTERKSACAKLMHTPEKNMSREYFLRKNYHMSGNQSQYDSFRNVSVDSERFEPVKLTPNKTDSNIHRRSVSGPANHYQQKVQYKTESFMRKLPVSVSEPKTVDSFQLSKSHYIIITDTSDEDECQFSPEPQKSMNVNNSFGHSDQKRIAARPLGADGEPYYYPKKSVEFAKQPHTADSSLSFTTRSDVSTTIGYSTSKNPQSTSLSQRARFESADIYRTPPSPHRKSVSMLDYETTDSPSRDAKQRAESIHYYSTPNPHERSSCKNLQTSLMNIQEESPTKSSEQKCFVDALVTLIELLADLEDYKIALTLRKDFTPFTAFKTMINVLGDDMIRYSRFVDILKAHGVALKSNEIAVLFKALDRDADGRIRFKDFESCVTPAQKECLIMLEKRENSSALTELTQDLVLELLVKICEAEMKWQEVKEQLAKQSEFSPKEVFRTLDSQAKSYINLNDLEVFFEKTHSKKVSQKDLECLLKRLDFDGDQQVSYKEFMREFS